jgi:small subunit ribosomal protein S21
MVELPAPSGCRALAKRFFGDFMPSDAIQCKPLEVAVSDRGIERAIKHLKRKLASEGVLRELKMRRHYMKPSIKRRKKQAEAARRRRKRAKMDAMPPKA